jgi:hypothetical protein
MKEIDPHLPVDKVAASVVSKSHDQGLDFVCGAKIVSMVPLPTTLWHGPKKDDLTGVRTGDFIVVGPSLWKPNNWRTSSNSARWVVRCKCGRYQILTTRAVKKNHPDNKCVECARHKKPFIYENN